MEGPLVAQTAYRHGIADAVMRHAFNNPLRAEDLSDGSILFVGPGPAGGLYWIGIVDSDEGPVIVHAMAVPETGGGVNASKS